MASPAQTLSPDILLRAYASGIFPMAEARDDPEIFWLDPRRRGILPLDGFHTSRSLRRRLRRGGHEVTVNSDFDGVLDGCAERDETWINDTIASLCRSLHRSGHAHSLEVRAGGALVGGVYGIAIGAAFFGESMFSRRADGSKIALFYLVDRLRQGGFTLFDTQFLTPHLASLGGVEVSRAAYRALLGQALQKRADFTGPPQMPPLDQAMQRMTHTS
ncbi:MAG: leucyl/phenylalanyl-tRNA--protein transferase [Parerythrobacter sp.]